jgi:regulatory Fis family protein
VRTHLADQRGSRSTAAKLLGISIRTLRNKIPDTLDVEKHCQIERPWSSARFGSQADKTADWVARTGVRMRLFCLIVLWLRDDRELSAGGLLILDRRALSLNVSTTLIGR